MTPQATQGRSATFTPAGEGRWLLNGGHVVLFRPDHPLANERGLVLEHQDGCLRRGDRPSRLEAEEDVRMSCDRLDEAERRCDDFADALDVLCAALDVRRATA